MKARNRRDFLKTSVAAGVAIAVPTIVSSSALGLGGAVAPSERIVLGGLGIGPRGTVDLKCFLKNPDVQFVAVADLQKTRREAVKTLVDGTYGNKDCVLYQDMYDILAREDIDSLLIATGDRWHTMASILAAKAGKDVYCEKPCSLTIAQSRALADAYRKYGRIYQAGTQRRTIGNFEFAKNLVRDGRLGKLHTIHANTRPPATTGDESTRARVAKVHACSPVAASMACTILSRPPTITRLHPAVCGDMIRPDGRACGSPQTPRPRKAPPTPGLLRPHQAKICRGTRPQARLSPGRHPAVHLGAERGPREVLDRSLRAETDSA